MIVFDKVSKKYGKTKVLDNVDLQIEAGEFVSVIGPSGAGKSTMMHLLIGADNVASGNIEVDGYIVNQMNDKQMQYYRRRIGVVFQDYKLLAQKNVQENVAFALEVCGWERAEIKKKTLEVLSKVGLSKKTRQFPYQLSGGEKQRLAIARALVHDPNLIIADEPTGNLDPDTAKDIIHLLLDINKECTTVIVTTHNRELVNYMKRRVVSLEDGKIVSDRTYSGYNK